MIKKQNENNQGKRFCKVHHFVVPFYSIFLDLNTVCSKSRISQHPLIKSLYIPTNHLLIPLRYFQEQ